MPLSDNEADVRVTSVLNQRQADLARARIRQFTGKSYPKFEAELTKLTVEALLDLVRIISDGQYEVQRAKNQAIHQPWRR